MLPEGTAEYFVDSDTYITPLALEYLRSRGIRPVIRPPEMPVTPIEFRGERTFVDERTGEGMARKPEELTHLRANRLVPKTDPRILFRGRLDSLQADIIAAQIDASEANLPGLVSHLGELLVLARELLGAEVNEERLTDRSIFGMNSRELRRASHDVKSSVGIDHPVPDQSMGKIAADLNALRTKVREIELIAAGIFEQNTPVWGEDLLRMLNRMSSAVYILFCRVIAGTYAPPPIPVEASARHVHLTADAVRTLFGHPLTRKRDLSIPSEFLSEERIKLVTPKGEIANVAILGPERKAVQVELSMTDARALGLTPPINLSGNLTGAAPITLVSEHARLEVPAAVIIAKAHIHLTPEQAQRFGVRDGDSVRVRVSGTRRPATFDDVIIRIRSDAVLTMHVDTDEANACGLEKSSVGTLIKK